MFNAASKLVSWAAGGVPATSAPYQTPPTMLPEARASTSAPSVHVDEKPALRVSRHVEQTRRPNHQARRARFFREATEFIRNPGGCGRRDRRSAPALYEPPFIVDDSRAPAAADYFAGGRAVDADREEDPVLDGFANAVT